MMDLPVMGSGEVVRKGLSVAFGSIVATGYKKSADPSGLRTAWKIPGGRNSLSGGGLARTLRVLSSLSWSMWAWATMTSMVET